jgi:COP9 signalosome complex subunit 7
MLTCTLFFISFIENVNQYPELTAEQKLKLKQLTIVNFSSKQRILPYATLMRELDINDVRQLEDMLIDCIYQGLIEGKLDQSQQSLEVYEAIGRDFKFNDLGMMIQVLHEWSSNAKKVLTALDTCSKRAIEQFEQAKKHKKEHESKVEEIEKTIKTAIEAQNESNTGAALMGMGMSFHEDKSARRMNQKRNR